jgi:hypothetical protein
MSTTENAPDTPTRGPPPLSIHSQRHRAGDRRRAMKAAAVIADTPVRGADGVALADEHDPKVINIAREHHEMRVP